MVKSILAINWSMSPMLSPQSLQIGGLLKWLARRGWRVFTVCADPGRAGQPVGLDPNMPMAEEVEQIRVASATDTHDPELNCWRQPAVSAARELIDQHEFGVLASFHQPWVDHLVGMDLAESNDLPWIAHFSDPWVDNIYHEPAKNLERWREEETKVVNRADVLVFTNHNALELVMAKYPSELKAKAAVMPHLYDPEPVSLVEPVRRHRWPRRLRLVHTGNFYGQRTPLPLFQAIADIGWSGRALEVVLAGMAIPEHRQTAKKLGLNRRVKFLGSVSHQQSLAHAAAADVLLVIDAPSQGPSPFLPSKAVEYLAWDKPLLAITPAGSPTDHLLRELGWFSAPPDNPDAVAQALVLLLETWKQGSVKLGSNLHAAEVAAWYEAPQVTARWEELLMQLMQAKVST